MKICLVGHNADALRGCVAGGSEKQIALLARHLARRGHEVTFVAVGYGGTEEDIDGVHLRSGWLPDRGLRGVRFFTYKLPHLRRVLDELGADVYYTRGGSFHTPTIIAAARRRRAVSILALASDQDLHHDAGKILFALGNRFLSSVIGPWVHRYYRRYCLQAADWVIAQNEEQAARCAALGLSYRVIPNMVEPPPPELLNVRPDIDVVWVGNITSNTRRSKGFAELSALCRMLPEVHFEIVGRLNAPSIQPLLAEVRQQPNVHLAGPLPFNETLERMARSRLVINTSPSEGFSNVMLEAWSLGKPTITLHVNPNGLLGPEGLGYCAAGSLTSMAAVVRHCLNDQDERRAIAARCLRHVRANHLPDVVCVQYESLFQRKDDHV